jgi:hypothetical protein
MKYRRGVEAGAYEIRDARVGIGVRGYSTCVWQELWKPSVCVAGVVIRDACRLGELLDAEQQQTANKREGRRWL